MASTLLPNHPDRFHVIGTGLKTLANPAGLTSDLLALRKEVNIRAEQFRSHAANLMVAFQRNFDQFALVQQEKSFSRIGAMLLGMEETSQASQLQQSQMMSILAEVAARGKALEALMPLLISSYQASTFIAQPATDGPTIMLIGVLLKQCNVFRRRRHSYRTLQGD